MGDKTGHRWATAAMEAESREWLVRCPTCGHERSIWELGGVRYKARGTKWIFRRCPACRQIGWHLVYREHDGVRLPPLRPARPLWWYVGAFAAILLLFVGLLVGFLVGLFLFLGRASADPSDATTGSFAAVVVRGWAIGSARRSAAAWAPRAARPRGGRGRARGSVDGFRVTGFSSKNGRTRVSGTLRYRDGATEPRTVWLIREDGAWKIAPDP